jgi:2,3-bisphosphoglycerate-dependent phosphoglycerate mutase
VTRPPRGGARYGGCPVPDAETLTQLVLIRHGESVSNAQSTIGGPRTCQGLSELGRAQCDRLAARLARTHEFDGALLYASQYRRAIETARIVGPAVGASEPTIDPAFGELDPGDEADGLSFTEFVDRYGMPDFGGDPEVPGFPGGESMAAMARRVRAGIERLITEHRGKIVVVCTHGGPVEAAMRYVIDAPVRGRFGMWTTNASITCLFRTPYEHEPWRLGRYNDAAHLLDAPAR